MNSQEIADAIKHHMKHTSFIASDAKLNSWAVDFKWNIGVFNDVNAVKSNIVMTDSLRTWPVGNSEIAKTVFEHLTMLDTTEVDYAFVDNNSGPRFICLWAEEVPANSIP